MKHTIWTKVTTNNNYLISIDGTIIALTKYVRCVSKHGTESVREFPGRELKSVNNGRGYYVVNIKHTCQGVHRILGLAYLPNIENKTDINHKDGNGLNNRIENLEWATSSENTVHAYNTGLQSAKHLNKPVSQYSLSGEHIMDYLSHEEASRCTDIGVKNIRKCSAGKGNTAGGFKWKRKQNVKR